MQIKVILSKFFNRTFGKIFRAIQLTLIQRYEHQDLHYHVAQLAMQDSAEYIVSNFSEAMVFSERSELWDYCIKRIPSLEIEGGVIAEFGVWRGESINFFAKKCPKARVYGFDSFEGLEEDWYGRDYKKGFFSTNGHMPKCEKNVNLVKGWFEDTLPKFCRELQQEQIKLLHMDADTYKPSAFVLSSLSKNLRTGTIVIFDEYFGYPNFRSHEFKAWKELVNSVGLKYRYIGYAEIGVAIEIL